MLFFALLALALAAPICLPEEHTVASIVMDPEKQFDDMQVTTFDLKGQRILVEAVMIDPFERHVHSLFLFATGKRYEYDPVQKECMEMKLEGKLEQECLMKDAKFLRQMKVGDAAADLYEEPIPGSEGAKLFLTMTHFTHIPIFLEVVDPQHGHHEHRHLPVNFIGEQFFDFFPTINATKFEVPSYCP